MKKKLISMLAIFAIIISFVGCNVTTTNETTVATNTSTSEQTTVQTTEEQTTVLTTEEQTTQEQTTEEQTTETPVVSFDYGVFNGDFEFNMQNWEYYTTDGFHDIDTQTFRNGEKSLSIENGATVYTSIWQTVTVGETDYPAGNDFVQFEAYFKGNDQTTGTVQLIIENVVNETTKIVLAKSEKTALTSDWLKVMSDVGEIPFDAEKINIVMIFETTGIVSVDDASLTKTISNNADAATILLDGEAIANFSSDVFDYTVYLPNTTLPTLTATAVKSDSTVVVTEATTVEENATVVVTAADGTMNTYTITFMVADPVDLADLLLDDESIAGFNSSKTDYYVMLETTTLPTITYETYYDETTVVVSDTSMAPQSVTLTVTNGELSKVYTIMFALENPLAYDMPNFDFESTFDWQTWSATENTPMASMEMSHGGSYALKTFHQSSVWKELEFSNTIPNVGDTVKIGAWVYIDSDAPVYDFRVKVVGITESTNAKQVFTEISVMDGIALNEWVYVESEYADILSADRIQFVIENNANSVVYIDDISVIDGVSSNASLSEILIDSVALDGFDASVINYVYLTDGISIPLVSVTLSNPNSTKVVTQALTSNGEVTIEVTAEDGTMKTYTIDFLVPSSGLLSAIMVDGVALDGFLGTKNVYYLQTASETDVFPTLTATLVDETDTLTIVPGESLPGYAKLTVETVLGETNEYVVYIETMNNEALTTPYPDVNFDKNLENWGFSSPTDVTQTSENFLNGTQSLKMVGGEAWLGIDLAGGAYPAAGNGYSIGMWLFVEGTETSGFRIRLFEKENNDLLINQVMSVTENNRWVYVETEVSGAVSDVPTYLQIVITNETGETVFVDGIRMIEHEVEVVVEPTSIYAIPDKNLDFEAETVWGFWSPSGLTVNYSTQVARDTQSLEIEEGSAWVGFGFDGPNYPAKGDTVKLGFWIYVDSNTATSVGGFTIKLLEKEGVIPGDTTAILYTTTDGEFAMDEWVYIETTQAVITDDPAYLQIVIEEGTDGTVYVDDIVVIQINE